MDRWGTPNHFTYRYKAVEIVTLLGCIVSCCRSAVTSSKPIRGGAE